MEEEVWVWDWVCDGDCDCDCDGERENELGSVVNAPKSSTPGGPLFPCPCPSAEPIFLPVLPAEEDEAEEEEEGKVPT